MGEYTTAVTDSLAASDLAEATYNAANTDLATQVAMDVITAAWKVAA